MIWNLYLDDIRTPFPTESWVVVRSYQEAINLILANGPPTNASLDHDLGVLSCQVCNENQCYNGDDSPECSCNCHVVSPTGYDLLKWMIDTKNWPLKTPIVHSANPVGRLNMQCLINNYERCR